MTEFRMRDWRIPAVVITTMGVVIFLIVAYAYIKSLVGP